MQISPLAALSTPIDANPARTQAEEIKTDFLTLLVSQIQNQDPLNPQDPSEFTAQLTQFSSLEQLINIGQSISEQSQLQIASLATSAASFIGKYAQVAGDKFELSAGTAGKTEYQLSRASSSTSISIYNESGALVRTVELGPVSEGSHDFTWDGLSDAGDPAPDGTYRFEVSALDSGGNDISTITFSFGVVDGVRFDQGLVLLQIAGEEYTLSDLMKIEEAPREWNV